MSQRISSRKASSLSLASSETRSPFCFKASKSRHTSSRTSWNCSRMLAVSSSALVFEASHCLLMAAQSMSALCFKSPLSPARSSLDGTESTSTFLVKAAATSSPRSTTMSWSAENAPASSANSDLVGTKPTSAFCKTMS